jgi:hypothetical protein
MKWMEPIFKSTVDSLSYREEINLLSIRGILPAFHKSLKSNLSIHTSLLVQFVNVHRITLRTSTPFTPEKSRTKLNYTISTVLTGIIL